MLIYACLDKFYVQYELKLKCKFMVLDPVPRESLSSIASRRVCVDTGNLRLTEMKPLLISLIAYNLGQT